MEKHIAIASDHAGYKMKLSVIKYLQEKGFTVKDFGTDAYFSMMTCAAAMVGNSSSGIIEAASFRLPVVNIGSRQEGRIRGRNVIDVENERKNILEGIRKALSSDFMASLSGMENPYGRGEASGVIFDILKQVNIDEKLIKKHFHDIGRVDQGNGK